MEIAIINKTDTLADKQEYFAIDFFRFIASLFIIAIHYPPFADVSYALSGGFSNILCRIAVPFFFITSGYFLGNKVLDSQKTISYIKKLIKLYLIYTVIYLPASINGYLQSGYSNKEIAIKYVRGLFISGSYNHLWYFLALIVSVILLYLIVNKLKFSDKTLLLIGAVLYTVGVLGCVFKADLLKVGFLKGFLEAYFEIFVDTKNGVFFGLLFVSIGYYISKYKDKFCAENKYFMLLILFLAVMCIEKVAEMAVAASVIQDMMFSLAPAATMLFLCLAFIGMSNKFKEKAMLSRQTSVLIFVWHPLIGVCFEKLTEALGWNVHSLIRYMVIMLVSVFMSLAIIKLSQTIKILKNLY